MPRVARGDEFACAGEALGDVPYAGSAPAPLPLTMERPRGRFATLEMTADASSPSYGRILAAMPVEFISDGGGDMMVLR
jgi:hypothetical protein